MTTDQVIADAWKARREHHHSEAHRDLTAHLLKLRPQAEPLELARTLCALGQIDRDLYNFPDSLRHYAEAVHILRSESAPLLLAHALRHLGDVQLEAAEANIREALDLYRQHPEANELDLANTLRSLALIKHDPALWQEARALYEKLNIHPGVAECDRHLRNS